MIAQDIIKRQKELWGRLRPDGLKTIAKIPATTWQPWFKEGQVVFSSLARLHLLSVSSASRQSSTSRWAEWEQAQLLEEALGQIYGSDGSENKKSGG